MTLFVVLVALIWIVVVIVAIEHFRKPPRGGLRGAY